MGESVAKRFSIIRKNIEEVLSELHRIINE